MKKSNSIPRDMLGSLGKQRNFKKMAQRRQSAPSLVIRGVLGRSNKLPASLYRDNVFDQLGPTNNNNSQRLSLKFGSHGATLNLSKRQYIMEGKVELTTGLQTQDRYMFLFSDLLLIAKAKSGSNYKLKSRVRVCELWIASCIDDVCELTRPLDRSFVIGWPTANCVATFSSPESKELWLNALLKKINEEKEKESPKTTTLKVVNRNESNASNVKFITVSHTDTAKDVLKLSVKEFDLDACENDFQLWVVSRKERTAYPLIGHEIPHAIQISNVRDTLAANGMISEMDFTSLSKYQGLINPEFCNKCKFILRSNRPTINKFTGDPMHWRSTRIKPKTPASFFNWARKRHATNQNGHRNDSSDSGLASLSGNSGNDGTSYPSPSPPLNESPTSPKLFSLPLAQVCEDGEIPKPITEILNILYRKAPYTTGIFRKSANAKTTRLLKQKLNEELDAHLSDAPIHVIAALFKDFLRNIPNSVLNSEMYNKWTDAIEQEDDEDKLYSLRDLFSELDAENRLLVWRMAVVLGRVVSFSKYNNMTSYNLSVCIAPSVLWPPGPGFHTDAPRKVTEILQFVIDHCEDVFEGIIPSDDDWPPAVDSQEENEEYQGETEVSNSVEEEMLQELENKIENGEYDDENEMDHFNRSGIIRRQLHRRHMKSGPTLRRMLSMSQDGLEQVLDNNTLGSDGSMLDDMILLNDINPDNRITRTQPMRRRGLDACNMSNDSGFTTLSGEEDDVISTSQSNTISSLNARFGFTSETTNGLGHDYVINEETSARHETFIVENSVTGINLRDIEIEEETTDESIHKIHLKVGINLDRSFASEPRPSRLFRRRQSQPVISTSARGLLKTPEVEFIKEHFTDASVLASPDADELDDNAGDVPDNYHHDRFLSVPSISEHKSPSFQPKCARLNAVETKERFEDSKERLLKENVLDRTTEEKMETFSAPTEMSPTRESDHASLPNADVGSPTITTDHASSVSESVENGPSIGVRELFTSCNYVEINKENELSFETISTEVTLDSSPRPKYLSPIQKLTVQLHSLPKFRERSMSTHDEAIALHESPVLRSRAKSSSVRLHRRRNRLGHSPQAHQTKSKPPLQATRSSSAIDDSFKSHSNSKAEKHVETCSTRSKTTPLATRSSSSIEDAFESHPKSNLRTETHIETYSTRTATISPLATRSSSSIEDTFEGQSKSVSRVETRVGKYSSRAISNPHATRSSSSIDDCFEPQPNTPPRLSPRAQGAQVENSALYGGSLPRRRRNRISKLASTLQNHAMTPDEGVHLFSSSLPAQQWEKRESESRSPAKSNIIVPQGLSSKGDHHAREKHCISPTFGTHGPQLLTSAQPVKLEISPGGVKSKIEAFNHIINDHEITVTPRSRHAVTHTRESPPSEAVSPTAYPPKRVLKGLKSTPIDFESAGRGEVEDDAAQFCTRSQDHRVLKNNLRTRGRNRPSQKVSISISCSPPVDDVLPPQPPPRRRSKECSSPGATRRSPQILSDELLFSLSESFAFGNRKSPRSLTPCGTPRRSLTPRDSPVMPRRSSTHSAKREKTKRESSNEREHHKTGESREGLTFESPRKYSIPAVISSPSCRRKGSGDSFPFLGFEKVIHSEESYV